MIAVEMRENSIAITGHSGHARQGEDIVCAGVSTLLQTLVRSIEDLTEDKITYQLIPGNGIVKWENLSEYGKLLVDSFFVGIIAIINTYPDHVKLV